MEAIAAPQASAAASHHSNVRPSSIAFCKHSIPSPSREAAIADRSADRPRGAWKRMASSKKQRERTPNIAAWAILSAPGKRGMSVSPTGWGASVSQSTPASTMALTVSGGIV